jgi:hypothetical protein
VSRGGPQNRGKALANNTSGLSGIRFAWLRSAAGDWLYPYVKISVHVRGRQRQHSYSVNKHGEDRALMLAIAARLRAGYITPTLETARVALRRFLKA